MAAYYRRRGDRMSAFTSVVGTKRTCRVCCAMSALRGKAENICSHRSFPVLTQLGHGPWSGGDRLYAHSRWPPGQSTRLLAFVLQREPPPQRTLNLIPP